MNLLYKTKLGLLFKAFLSLCICSLPIMAADDKDENEDEIYELSPFTVDVSKDKGYLATNAISGTRLSSAIRDLPMPIEVITEDFLRDTGSDNLRQALKFSSGILLQSQNDYGAPGGHLSPSPGKVNNPEGSSGSAYQTSVKIRGFQTDSVLRDGFRRRNSTDSVNISRVEVVRGPAALLYGVGNFGGVVNYLVKHPTGERSAQVSTAVGSYGLLRGTVDVTDKITDSGSLSYRLTGAYQQVGSYEEFNEEQHYFVSPVIVYRPFKDTEILLDFEYGEQERDGISWRRLRSVASNFINWDGGEAGSFLNPEGTDPQEFRWSGPDTYNHNAASNVEVKVTQKLMDELYLMVGYNRSAFDYQQLDNMASLELSSSRSSAPEWSKGIVDFTGIGPGIPGLTTGEQEAVIAYAWQHSDESNVSEQLRAELNYTLRLFENTEKSWMKSKHDFLFGYTNTDDETERHTRQTPRDVANFHNPTDANHIRFGTQGDGVTPDIGLVEHSNEIFSTKNPAMYAVYQGTFWEERINLVAGVRRDENSNYRWQYNPEIRFDGSNGADTEPFEIESEKSTETTRQYGVNVKVSEGISVYAMRSEGVQPNFNGYLDFYGKPITATLAVNNEVGLKVDLFDGKISGTISKFRITRERAPVGAPSSVWYAPVVTPQNRFDPNRDIVYQVNDFNPYTNDWNAAVVASTAEWDLGVNSGAIYQDTNSGGDTNWYVNASQVDGAALMDAVFANAYATNSLGWFGWPYNQDNLTHSAFIDYNGEDPPGPTANRSVALGSDRAEGWDMQLVITPTDNLQVVLSWAQIDKTVLSAGQWAKYPHTQDRWAPWYFPATWAGLQGQTLEDAYTDPLDTSTRVSVGTGLQLDDTPDGQGSFWLHYVMPEDHSLSGFSFGLGGNYEGPRQYFSGITHGGGAVIAGEDGNPLSLETDDRYEFDGFMKYEFQLKGKDASIQLNVQNLLDTQKLHGLIYQAPRTWRMEFNYHF